MTNKFDNAVINIESWSRNLKLSLKLICTTRVISRVGYFTQTGHLWYYLDWVLGSASGSQIWKTWQIDLNPKISKK